MNPLQKKIDLELKKALRKARLRSLSKENFFVEELGTVAEQENVEEFWNRIFPDEVL